MQKAAMKKAIASAFLSIVGVVGVAHAQDDAAAEATTPADSNGADGLNGGASAPVSDPTSGADPKDATSPDAAAGSSQDAQSSADLPTIPVNTTEDKSVPTGDSAVHNRVIEEIVVTAQKREENIQDVPISIQAFSAEALDARGVQDTSQLAQSVPSLQFINAAGFQLIFMRGIGTDNPIPSADRSIATYIDGIYLPVGQSVVQGISTVERVEVLKGPQGTLFGRNATGGAINIITADPGNQFTGEVSSEVGNYNDHQLKANVTIPVADWLSFSLSGSYSKIDSFYTNINYEEQPETNRAARLKVHLQPFDDLSVNLTAFHSDYTGASAEIAENTNPSPLGRLLLISPQPDDYVAESDFKVQGQSNQNFYYGTAAYNTPWFDIKFLGSDIQARTPYTSYDFDGSSRPYVGFDGSHEFTDQKTGELQLVSNADSWLSDKLKWTVGLYYLESKIGLHPAHIHVAPDVINAFTGIDTSGINDLLSALGLENTPFGPEGVNLSFFGTLGTKSYSGYAQATYSFTDWLDLTLGGRDQHEKRYLIESHTDLTNLNNSGSTRLLSFPLDSATASNFSPKAVLGFHPADNSLIYLSYATGFKSGTYNIVNIYRAPNYIVPEKITTYELGTKTDFLGGRLRLNGALFWNDIKNLQTAYISLLAGGTLRFQTAGAARTRGAEFDGTFLPFPHWNPGLALTANGAYVDAKYTDFKHASGYNKEGLFLSGVFDFSGNHMVYAPKLSGSLGVVQTIEVPTGNFEVALDEYYNGGFYADSPNLIHEHAYSVLNARLSYFHLPWDMRATVFGRNVLDRRYHMQRFQNDFGVMNALAPPRTYGLMLDWNF
ncbi:TonB-dependent receptor [Solimonas terrae]|uniref:TonB-dependent receptor n=1 Tax=Solimonas terrae TaxID=1396819 RepID=A0A6M2BWJ7_9GAMM|nr:TonB-dependent receptor [Solimonas terrae]NGY07012.1 TonB-dependent receptor [Solimonas terrae]